MTVFEAASATTRIGLLVPSSNAVMEVELYRSLPNDITVHTSARLRRLQSPRSSRSSSKRRSHVPLQAAYDVGLRAAAKGDADALFMSGTGVHTLGVAGALEKRSGSR